jgi:hypothetical protein
MRSLRLRPRRATLLPNLPRDWSQVEPALRSLFGELVTGRAKWPCYLHGPVGAGKSRAALALCDVVHTASFWRLDRLVDGWLNPDVRAAIVWQLEERELIVIDELGARSRTNDLELSVLREVYEIREAHASAAAIFVSNLRPAQLPDFFDQRLASRLCSGTIFELTATCDRRLA